MNQIVDLKVNARRRLEFIEFQLIWEGAIGRLKLKDQFEISLQQATLDLNSYVAICPDNMVYDPKKKTYVSTEKFKPQFISGDTSEYFSQLEMLHSGYKNKQEIWVHTLPSFDAVSIHRRNVRKNTLAIILKAIREGRTVRGQYSSLRSGSDTERNIVPCAIASDGHRWHMRGFDCEENRFADFVLSRFNKVELIDGIIKNLGEDADWETYVEVNFQVDPSMDASQKKQMEYEYQMSDEGLKVRVRKAMVFYYLRSYGFDPLELENGIIRNKSSFHLIIDNLDEVEEWLGRR